MFLEGTFHLKRLTLIQCDLNFKSTRTWSSQLTSLQELIITQCPFLNFRGLQFCNYLTSLQVLEVRNCKSLGGRWFYEGLVQTLPNVKCIVQNGFTKQDEYCKEITNPLSPKQNEKKSF